MPGRNFVVTGAFGALGSTVANAANARGERIALVDYGQSAPVGLPESAVILGGVDLTDPAAAGAAIDHAASSLGGIDALLNIAGGFTWEKVEGGSPEPWLSQFRVNALTATNACRAAIPHLKRSSAGRIVNIGANAAIKAGVGMGAYSASKAAVHSLTQALAEELKADGVTVNAVLPSTIDTPANRAEMPTADFSTWVAPSDLAAVILFLATEEARAVTGALLPVTGRA
jgi:NAD(P)-dependent dehydrogenase (short-subunit alcohol dehydrogenase family)